MYGIPRWDSGNDPEGFRPEAGGCGVGVTHTLTRAGREGPGDHRAYTDVRGKQCNVFCGHRHCDSLNRR